VSGLHPEGRDFKILTAHLNMMYFPPPTSTLPTRVQAAMQFISMMNTKVNGSVSFTGERSEGTCLNNEEKSTYNQALVMLRHYFSGEMDFGDAPPISPGNEFTMQLK
jgi:hypothetical protein